MSKQNWPALRAPVSYLILGFLLLVPIAAAEPPPEGSEDAFLNESETFTWKGLNRPRDYTEVCSRDENNNLVCVDSCPSDSICAEYSNMLGDVHLYCCISPESEGRLDIDACMYDVQLVRSGPPELEDSPWL